MTLVLTGHETTTHALTFTLALLGRNPAAYERMIAEVDEVLGGREPLATDVDALPWTKAVICEALRLYPPGCYLIRDAAQDDDILGVPVRAGDTIAVSPYLLHRIPELWPDPRDSTRDDSCRELRPLVQTMRIFPSAPAAASALARAWPSWR